MDAAILDADTLLTQRVALQARYSEQLCQVEQAQDQLAAAHQKLAALEVELAQLAQLQVAASSTPPDPATQHQRATPGVSLILNPAAKHFLDGIYRPEQIIEALRAVGITPQVELTTPEINARQLACKAVDRGDTLIIAAGGDGTIEEVATTLIHTPATLGILPLGTMNNLARSLGIPLDLPMRRCCWLSAPRATLM